MIWLLPPQACDAAVTAVCAAGQDCVRARGGDAAMRHGSLRLGIGAAGLD